MLILIIKRLTYKIDLIRLIYLGIWEYFLNLVILKSFLRM